MIKIKTAEDTLAKITGAYIKTDKNTLAKVIKAYQVYNNAGVKDLRKIFDTIWCEECGANVAYEYLGYAEPGCDYNGYWEYLCTNGHSIYKDNEDTAYGHDFGSGNDKEYCQNGCGTRNNNYEEPCTHPNKVIVNYQAPTCVAAGNNEYEYCPDCTYKSLEDEKISIPATGIHNFEDGYCTYDCGTVDPDYEPPCEHPDEKLSYSTYWDDLYGPMHKAICSCGYEEANYTTCSLKNYQPVGSDNVCYTYTCKDCNTTWEYGHNIQSEEAKEATCTESGHNAYEYCTDCNYSTYEEIPASHDKYYDEPENTCKGGWAVELCHKCDWVGEKVWRDPTAEHTSGEPVIENEVAATCTDEGSYYKVVYCTECGEELTTEFVTTDALGHTEAINDAVEPSCTRIGWTEGKYCSVCNEVLVEQREVSMTDHNYQFTEHKATCTDGGYTDWYCTNFESTGTVEGSETPPNGHTYESVVTNPTCTDGGYTTHTCHCGDSYISDQTPAHGHFGERVPGSDPTCTAPGYTDGYQCTICNNWLEKQQIIRPLGHDWELFQGDDYEYNVCTRCGEKEECLIEGTLITMADGTQKPIEEVKSGDLIKSYDPNTNTACDAVVINSSCTGRHTNYITYNMSNDESLTVFGGEGYYDSEEHRIKNLKLYDESSTLQTINNEKITITSAVPAVFAQTKKHYLLLPSNNLYYANNILMGHNPKLKLTKLGKEVQTLPANVQDILIADTETVKKLESKIQEAQGCSDWWITSQNLFVEEKSKMFEECCKRDNEHFELIKIELANKDTEISE